MLFFPIFPINTRNSGIHKMLWMSSWEDHNLFGSDASKMPWKLPFSMLLSSFFFVFVRIRAHRRAA